MFFRALKPDAYVFDRFATEMTVVMNGLCVRKRGHRIAASPASVNDVGDAYLP
jgi:hypothetical protein